MLFWIREICGWILIAIGLNSFRISYAYLTTRQVVEAGIAAAIGVFVFRGGIHLLKVAVASRVVSTLRRERAAAGTKRRGVVTGKIQERVAELKERAGAGRP